MYIYIYIYILYIYSCKRLLNTLTKRGCNKTDTIKYSKKRVTKQIKTSNTERLSLTDTYNRTLPDLKPTIDKNSNILQIEPKLRIFLLNVHLWHSKKTKTLET